MKDEKDERAKEFLACLGNGKTIYQIEEEEKLREINDPDND